MPTRSPETTRPESVKNSPAGLRGVMDAKIPCSPGFCLLQQQQHQLIIRRGWLLRGFLRGDNPVYCCVCVCVFWRAFLFCFFSFFFCAPIVSMCSDLRTRSRRVNFSDVNFSGVARDSVTRLPPCQFQCQCRQRALRIQPWMFWCRFVFGCVPPDVYLPFSYPTPFTQAAHPQFLYHCEGVTRQFQDSVPAYREEENKTKKQKERERERKKKKREFRKEKKRKKGFTVRCIHHGEASTHRYVHVYCINTK